MASPAVVPAAPSTAVPRRAWLAATLVLTLAPIVAAAVLAPPGSAAPAGALVWLLFIGSATHVGATAWFYTVPEVRRHMSAHRTRYVWVPVVLVVAGAVTACVLPVQAFTWGLIGFFVWQFLHFQKQNLGVTALAARAVGARGLTVSERRALVAAGSGGSCALVGHPGLLQLDPQREIHVLFPLGADRQLPFAAVFVTSLVFFGPVFLFGSPYAAVAGMTVAHGLQYLLLLGLLSHTQQGGRSPLVGVLVMANIALVAGLVLSRAAHLHGGGVASRVVFGAYLGVVMTHFVVDAGLWRLREEFPRRFLTERLPFLLAPGDLRHSAGVNPAHGRT